MSTLSLRTVPALTQPGLLRAAQRLANVELLSFYRALAASADPVRFTLPSARDAAEHVYARMVARRSPEQLAGARRQAVGLLSQPPAMLGARFPGLGGLVFNSVDSVSAQARRMASPIPATGITAQPVATDGPALVPSAQLVVSLLDLSCERETSKIWPETDPDSIDVAATLIDVRNPVADAVAFNAGRDFRTGTAHRYQPGILLGAVDVMLDQNWPKVYVAQVLILERDDGGSASEDMKVVFNRVRDDVARWVAEGAGGLLSAYVGAELGRTIGQVIGEVIKRLADAVLGAFGNDVFRAQSLSLEVPDAAALSNREAVTQALRFDDVGGLYLMNVGVDWRRTDVPVAQRRVDAIEVRIGTGGDDLRGNSTAWAGVTFADGTEARVSLNNGDGLGNNSQRVFTMPVSPQRRVGDLRRLTIHHHSNNGTFETDDNWNLDSVRLRTNGPDPVTEVLNLGGGPLKRFTGQDHDWAVPIAR